MNHIQGNKTIAVSRKDKRIDAFIQGWSGSSFVLPKEIKSIAADKGRILA